MGRFILSTTANSLKQQKTIFISVLNSIDELTLQILDTVRDALLSAGLYGANYQFDAHWEATIESTVELRKRIAADKTLNAR